MSISAAPARSRESSDVPADFFFPLDLAGAAARLNGFETGFFIDGPFIFFLDP